MAPAFNRYYDPTTNQFVSIDPMVAKTDQPYAFVNDGPLNWTDPLGLKIAGTGSAACNIQQTNHLIGLISCLGVTAGGKSAVGTFLTTAPVVYNYLPIGVVAVRSTVSIIGASSVTVGNTGVKITSGKQSATFGFNGSLTGSLNLPGGMNVAINNGGISVTGTRVQSTFGNDKVAAQTTVTFYPGTDIPPSLTDPAIGVGILTGVWAASPYITWIARAAWKVSTLDGLSPTPVE